MGVKDEVTIGSDAPRVLRKDAARNRALLITAGRDVFARRGLDASLDEIARQAGVGIGTAYRHFANKLELAEAIMHETLDEVYAAGERAEQDPDPWRGLVGFLEAVLKVQTKDRGLREFMTGFRNPHLSDDVYDRLGLMIKGILDRAKADGAVRADLSVTDLGFLLAMLCEVSDLAGDTDPTLWRRYFGVLLAGLRPDGPELTGTPLTEQQFRQASEDHHRRRAPN